MHFSGDQLLPNLKLWKESTTQVLGEGKISNWGVARTKGEVQECKFTKKMFFDSNFLQLCLKKNRKIN